MSKFLLKRFPKFARFFHGCFLSVLNGGVLMPTFFVLVLASCGTLSIGIFYPSFIAVTVALLTLAGFMGISALMGWRIEKKMLPLFTGKANLVSLRGDLTKDIADNLQASGVDPLTAVLASVALKHRLEEIVIEAIQHQDVVDFRDETFSTLSPKAFLAAVSSK